MQHLDFELKPSRFARAVHMTVLLAIALITWPSLQLWAWCLLIVLALSSYLLWRKQAQVTRLAQLDGALWSVQYQSNAGMRTGTLSFARNESATSKPATSKPTKNKPAKNTATGHAQHHATATQRDTERYGSAELHQVQLLQVLDHAVYIVLRFEHRANVVIWRDQLPTAR